MNILGISAYYHDSAAALVQDGEIKAAAQQERFTRKKHDAAFPAEAIQYCLGSVNLSLKDVDYVVFYDKPLIKFERLLETYLAYAPLGFRSFVAAIPIWLKEKLYLKATLKKALADLGNIKGERLEDFGPGPVRLQLTGMRVERLGHQHHADTGHSVAQSVRYLARGVYLGGQDRIVPRPEPKEWKTVAREVKPLAGVYLPVSVHVTF